MKLEGVWRARVIEVHEGQMCTVTVPALFGDGPVGPVPHVPLTVRVGDAVLAAAVNGELSEMTVISLAREEAPATGPGLFTRVTLTEDPVEDSDAATKAYVDAAVAALRAELTV